MSTGACAYLWESVGVSGSLETYRECLSMSMRVCACRWDSMGVYGSYGSLLFFLGANGIYGYLWVPRCFRVSMNVYMCDYGYMSVYRCL